MGVTEGDTSSLDYDSFGGKELRSLEFRVFRGFRVAGGSGCS